MDQLPEQERLRADLAKSDRGGAGDANLVLVIAGLGAAASLFVAAIPPLLRTAATPPAS